MSYEQLDKMRKKLKNNIICISLLFLLIFFFYVYILSLCKELNLVIFVLIIFFLIFVFYMILVSEFRIRYIKVEKEYIIAFKEHIVRKSLDKIFTNLNYYPNSGIDESLIASTNVKMGNKYSSNDLVTGSYKGINFMQSDIFIGEDTSDGMIEYFKGKWMVFDFNKRFKFNLYVCQNDYIIKSFILEDDLKCIEMESIEFNEKFSVYAENEIDAFYILTPKMMERLINLYNLNRGNLLLNFRDNKLHVGIYCIKDSFESGDVFEEIDQEKVFEDIKNITMFVDELDLDNDLFMVDEKL